jgi:geranylgeranyl reductase family protein
MKVVIVGAGPAGSSAGYFLAQRGVDVVIVEKNRFPRDKVCGDGLTPRSVWMLERMGLASLVDDKSRAGAAATRVDSVYLKSPAGHVLACPLPAHIFGGHAAVVAREVLDHALVEHATKAGAKLVEDFAVSSIERGDRGVTIKSATGDAIAGDVVLGCDGAPSVVRKHLGSPEFPDDKSAFAVRVYYEGLEKLTHPDAYALFWERDLLPAYGWIFPLGNGRANVGLGLRTDQMRDHAKKTGEKLPALLDRFCAMPNAMAELAGGRRVGRVRGHPLPFGSFRSRLAFDRALLLGDAAGFINPLTGEGIEFALESGEIAAAVLVDAGARGDFTRASLDAYEAKCRERFQKTFDMNQKMQAAFSVPWLVDRIVRAASSSDVVRNQLADILLGESPKLTPRLAVAAVAAR